MARDHERRKKHHRHKSARGSGSSSSSAKAPAISEGDYFLRATEFRVWLAQTKCVSSSFFICCLDVPTLTHFHSTTHRNTYVEDLTTHEATALFRRKFVKKWNRGQLARMFYDGIPEPVLEQTRRTKHTWGFASRLSDQEAMALASARDSVGVATRKTDLLAVPRPQAASEPEPRENRESQDRNDVDAIDERTSSHKRKSRDHHHHRPDDSSDDDTQRRRADRKRHRQHRERVLEELVPKETGREAALEKRRQVAGKVHGAARDREENRDGLDVSDAFLMGGGDSSGLQRRLQAREHARDRRHQEQLGKLDEFKVRMATGERALGVVVDLQCGWWVLPGERVGADGQVPSGHGPLGHWGQAHDDPAPQELRRSCTSGRNKRRSLSSLLLSLLLSRKLFRLLLGTHD